LVRKSAAPRSSARDYQPEGLRRAGDDRDPAFIPATLRRLRERQRLERLLRHGFSPGSLANISRDQVGCANENEYGRSKCA
jgi:hypothetical protein